MAARASTMTNDAAISVSTKVIPELSYFGMIKWYSGIVELSMVGSDGEMYIGTGFGFNTVAPQYYGTLGGSPIPIYGIFGGVHITLANISSIIQHVTVTLKAFQSTVLFGSQDALQSLPNWNNTGVMSTDQSCSKIALAPYGSTGSSYPITHVDATTTCTAYGCGFALFSSYANFSAAVPNDFAKLTCGTAEGDIHSFTTSGTTLVPFSGPIFSSSTLPAIGRVPNGGASVAMSMHYSYLIEVSVDEDLGAVVGSVSSWSIPMGGVKISTMAAPVQLQLNSGRPF